MGAYTKQLTCWVDMELRVAVMQRMVAGEMFMMMSVTVMSMCMFLPPGALLVREMSVGARI